MPSILTENVLFLHSCCLKLSEEKLNSATKQRPFEIFSKLSLSDFCMFTIKQTYRNCISIVKLHGMTQCNDGGGKTVRWRIQLFSHHLSHLCDDCNNTKHNIFQCADMFSSFCSVWLSSFPCIHHILLEFTGKTDKYLENALSVRGKNQPFLCQKRERKRHIMQKKMFSLFYGC